MPLDLLPYVFSCSSVGRGPDGHLGPYPGYARDGAPDRALFTFEEAERIAEAWKALPAPDRPDVSLASEEGTPDEEGAAGPRNEAHYNAVEKAFWFYDAEADEWHRWKGEDVGLATLYAIGEGAWRWECRS